MKNKILGLAVVFTLITGARPALAAAGGNPTRDPYDPSYPPAKSVTPSPAELAKLNAVLKSLLVKLNPTIKSVLEQNADFSLVSNISGNAPVDADGNFIVGPNYTPAPETRVNDSVPQGTVYNFTMHSEDSKFYPGIHRDAVGRADPNNPLSMIVNSYAAPYTRRVGVYVPSQYVPGTPAPFIVGADGVDTGLFTVMNNLIAEHKIPVMIGISIQNGGDDAQGSERGLEYDTMSGKYAEFVEAEVLPLVESQYHVTLTKDPNGRATTGTSSGGSAAFIMAWYHPDLYRRVMTFSGTYVNQQWPLNNPETPHGAWEFHEHLIPNSPAKPLRVWLEVGDKDLLNPNVQRDNMHDWVIANENMARVLAAKGYHYQLIFALNAGHGDGNTKQHTIAEALEWLWKDYPNTPAK